MWEIFYLGVGVPYANIKCSAELVTYLKNQHRLDKPPLCPQVLFELMMSCWNQLYQFRPTFSQIQDDLKIFKDQTAVSQKNIISEEVDIDQEHYSKIHYPDLENLGQNCSELTMVTNRTYNV